MSRTDHARPAKDTRRGKVLSILRDQRIRIVEARSPEGYTVPNYVIARVKGHMGVYAVDLVGGRWTCTCRDGASGDCAHAFAARFVTGHAGGPS